MTFSVLEVSGKRKSALGGVIAHTTPRDNTEMQWRPGITAGDARSATQVQLAGKEQSNQHDLIDQMQTNGRQQPSGGRKVPRRRKSQRGKRFVEQRRRRGLRKLEEKDVRAFAPGAQKGTLQPLAIVMPVMRMVRRTFLGMVRLAQRAGGATGRQRIAGIGQSRGMPKIGGFIARVRMVCTAPDKKVRHEHRRSYDVYQSRHNTPRFHYNRHRQPNCNIFKEILRFPPSGWLTAGLSTEVRPERENNLPNSGGQTFLSARKRQAEMPVLLEKTGKTMLVCPEKTGRNACPPGEDRQDRACLPGKDRQECLSS
jgi:hypothetical protein